MATDKVQAEEERILRETTAARIAALWEENGVEVLQK